MKRKVALYLVASLAMGSLPGIAMATPVTASNSHLSQSRPHLSEDESAWAPFSVAQGLPAAGKTGISLQYFAEDGTADAFPLRTGTASIGLRPTGAGASVACTPVVVAPDPDDGNGGQCFYLTTAIGPAGVLPEGDTLRIYYMGMLGQGEPIRYTVSGLEPAVAGYSITSFDSDEVLPGTPPEPTESRLPARLVLVLDRSGSMNWSSDPTDAACGPTYSPVPACRRWNILNEAVQKLVNVAKPYALPGDRFGVASFAATADSPGAMGPMNPTTLDGAITYLNSISPGGTTSIGAGVEELRGDFTGPAGEHNDTMLLFTDGEQNRTPYLGSDGENLLLSQTLNLTFGDVWPDANQNIRLCPFRLRTTDAPGPGSGITLQQIADIGCNGMMNAPATLIPGAPDLTLYFLQVLNEALFGDKLETVSLSAGSATVAGGEVALGTGLASSPDGESVPFVLSRDDVGFTLLLSWTVEGDGRRVLPGELVLVKDGIEIPVLQNPQVRVSHGTDHLTMSMRAPYCSPDGCLKPEGEWTLRFTAHGTPSARMDYHVFVVSDNASLASEFRVTQPTPGVGLPLQLRVELSEAGTPVGGLGPDAVVAFVSGPGLGLGNVLSASRAKPAAFDQDDTLTPAALKVDAMLADPDERDSLIDALRFGADQRIALTETSPGVYGAEFTDTHAEGIYRIAFQVSAEGPRNGEYQRIHTTDHYVRVVPSVDATLAGATVETYTGPCAPAGGCDAITLTPVDDNGNLIGPGKGPIIMPTRFDGELIQIHDHLDGSYTLVVGYPPDLTRPPVIDIGGVAIPLPGSAPHPPSDNGSAPWSNWPWWWWLVLIVILVLLWLLWSRKSA